MQEQTQNTPFKLVTDRDETLYQPEEAYVLDNVRIEEKDTFFLVNIKEEETAFRLNYGFKAIGVQWFNGVYYVAAYNETSDQFMAGSYPSINPTTEQLDYTFRPFQTYTQDANYINETTCFYDVSVKTYPLLIDNIGVDLRKVEIKVYNRNDGSVNILILHPNGNIVLNSGFNTKGYTKKGYINDQDIAEKTYLQFNESVVQLEADVDVKQTGTLLGGTYTIYARYKSLMGSVTSYRKVSDPVQVFYGTSDDPNHTKRNKGTYYNTNKSLEITFTKISNAYPFIELAVLFSYGENAAFLQAYKVEKEIFRGDSYTLFSNDDLLPIELGDLLSFKTAQKGCETGTIINDRFIGANWHSKDNYNQAICDYVAKIYIEEDYFLIARDDFNGTTVANKHQHSVDMPRAYFSGEAYAFLAHPVFNDGTIGLGYPMKGRDNWNGMNSGPTNTDGIYRFSNPVVKPNYTFNNEIYGKRPKFNLSIANASVSQFISENIVGFVYSVAKLKPNRLYQGYTLRCSQALNDIPENVFSPNDANVDTENVMPLLGNISYYLYQNKGTNSERSINIRQQSQSPARCKYAMFSIDYMIDADIGTVDLSNAVLMKIGTFSKGFITGKQITPIPQGNLIGSYIDGLTPDKQFFNVSCTTVGAWQQTPNNGYLSSVPAGSATTGWYFYSDLDQTAFNLGMATPAYIGIEDEEDVQTLLDINESLCALYSQHPEQINITDWYNIRTELYSIKKGMSTLKDSTFTILEGDCYPQRNGFKTLSALTYDEYVLEYLAPSVTTGNDNVGFAWYLSSFSENKHNNYGRIIKGGNTYFPGVSFDAHVYTFGQPESFFYNYGYDHNQLYSVTKFDAKYFDYDTNEANLVAHTDKQTANSNEDAFRSTLSGEQKIYNVNAGDIKKVFNFNNQLVAVHEEKLYLIAIDERVPIADGSNIVLGNTTYLNEQTQLIGSYGTQSTFGACQDNLGVIYGLDVNKQTIWRFAGQFDPVSISKLCNKAVHNLIFGNDDNQPLRSVQLDGYDLNRLDVSFDNRFKEIVFTIENNGLRNLVFSTLANEFVGTRSHGFVSHLSNELISYDNSVFVLPYGEGYKEVNSSIGFISTKRVNLQYHSHWLIAIQPDLGLKQINWETNYQEANTIVNVAPYWYKPAFKNGMLFIPIPRNQLVINQFDKGSVMAGDFCKVKIIINQDTKLELKGILTTVTNNFG